MLVYYFENSRDFSMTYSLLLHNDLRDHTLSMLEAEGGRGRVVGAEGFWGVMKYFGHILMNHEIFLKSFDGSQNIFLRSFLVLTFSKFS